MAKSAQTKKKVVVGLSGGVDSSVAAALLLKKGYSVIGVFMRNWSEDIGDFSCSWNEDLEDARRVAQLLNIPFYVWNFEKEYKKQVIDYFFKEYKSGRTPNPDVMCNREIKFNLFLKKALQFGADFVATGHYARIVRKDNYYHLLRGRDANKDQSYFLYTLSQKELSKSLFPVGEYAKPQIRALAKKFKLPTFDKPDSQGICFIGEVDVADLLRRNITMKPGNIIDTDKKILGRHQGLALYTLGQRGGLDIGGKGPYYVVAKDVKKNAVIVSNDPNNNLLWRRECLVGEISWTRPGITLEKITEATVRYRQSAQKVTAINKGKKLRLLFSEAQRAITPGQSAVFYHGDELLGGGVIEKVV